MVSWDENYAMSIFCGHGKRFRCFDAHVAITTTIASLHIFVILLIVSGHDSMTCRFHIVVFL